VDLFIVGEELLTDNLAAAKKDSHHSLDD